MRNFILILWCASMFGCSPLLLNSEDWVVEGVFTQGIEGPAVDAHGRLYAVNVIKQGTIGIVDDVGNVDIFLSLPGSSIGNGIRFDGFNNMYIADYVNHIVWRVDMASKALQIHARNTAMNQPNDLAIMDNGILFASDPNWTQNNGNLWRIAQDGKTHLLADKMGTTNGIEVSPDNKILYVNESVQRKVWRFDIDEQGNLTNKQLHIAFSDYGLDGMRADQAGNLYIARYGKGVITVVSPKGLVIREIKLIGSYPTNVAFGGSDGKTVYVTMQKRGAIERFRVPIAGRTFNSNQDL